MTHAELVDRAVRWIRRRGCSTIITHKFTNCWEEPDAIGWKGFGYSLLVECKVSRTDFLRDKKKGFRSNPSLGMGSHRVYMTPPGLVKVEELPPLWGLVEVVGRVSKVIVKPSHFTDKNWHAELKMVLSHTRRIEGVAKPMKEPAK